MFSLSKSNPRELILDYVDQNAVSFNNGIPTINMDAMHSIVEGNSLAIMPTEVFNLKASLEAGNFKSEQERKDTIQAVKNFADGINRNKFDTYAVGPISYLDQEVYIKENAKYAAKMFGDAAMMATIRAVDLLAPTILSLQSQVKSILEQQRIQQAEQERRARIARDPILIAVNKGANIRDPNTIAILGPCWGLDIPEDVKTSLVRMIQSKNSQPSPQLTQQVNQLYLENTSSHIATSAMKINTNSKVLR